MSRFFPDYDPLKFNDTLPPYADRPFPGVCWMKPQGSTQAFYARLRFTLNEKTTIRFHVSGDRWFDLRLDGQFITDGPECSDSAHGCYSSFEEELMPGEHERQSTASQPASRLNSMSLLRKKNGMIPTSGTAASKELAHTPL